MKIALLRSRIAFLFIVALFAPLLAAANARAGLSQSFQQVGHLGLEVAGAPGGNHLISSGTLTLSQLPATAVVVRATLYTSQLNNGAGLDAVFAGTNLGSVPPAASDVVCQRGHLPGRWRARRVAPRPVCAVPFPRLGA